MPQDLFSNHSSDYARYRPTYPAALFDYLASICAQKRLAWDCATGNGQAAIELASRFEHVIATDLSQKQLTQAPEHSGIDYRVATAEDSGITPDSVDLITVAQALHWFDLPAFYAQAQKVGRTSGSWIAIWGYSLASITPQVDALVSHYYSQTVGPYWDPARKIVNDGYRAIAFPFAETTPPPFSMETEWDLAHFLGYLGTWSATHAATQALGTNPLETLAPKLQQAWGEPHHALRIRWPLHLRVGRIHPNSSV